MRLMADWIMPFQGDLDRRHDRRAKCRVRIYEHGEPPGYSGEVPRDRRPLIVLSDLPDNEGESVASAAEVLVETLLTLLADLVGREAVAHPATEGELGTAASAGSRLAHSATFISHYPPQITGTTQEAYDLIRFDAPRAVEMEVDPETPSAPRRQAHPQTNERPTRRNLWYVDGVALTPLDAGMVRELLGEPSPAQ